MHVSCKRLYGKASRTPHRIKDMRTTPVTVHRQSKDGKGKRREVKQNERSNKLDQVMGGRAGGTGLHLNDTLDLYAVAAQPIDGQFTDNAASIHISQ